MKLKRIYPAFNKYLLEWIDEIQFTFIKLTNLPTWTTSLIEPITMGLGLLILISFQNIFYTPETREVPILFF